MGTFNTMIKRVIRNPKIPVLRRVKMSKKREGRRRVMNCGNDDIGKSRKNVSIG